VVSGEAGIGKTRLIEAFLGELRRAGDVDSTLGQCLEPLGVEPYSPLLEAVGRLCRGSGSAAAPVLRGTIRDHATQVRRPFIRFFACGQDLSHEPPEARLPDPVATGAEPFLIVGAMAGG
jgi:hypothetical protein